MDIVKIERLQLSETELCSLEMTKILMEHIVNKASHPRLVKAAEDTFVHLDTVLEYIVK